MQRQRTRFEIEPVADAAVPRSRFDHALNEARTLILASQVMLGFQYRAGFEPGLARLPQLYFDLKLGSMGMMLLSLGLLAMPATHRLLARRGREPEVIDRVANGTVKAAMVPFALSLGLDVTIAVAAVAGSRLGWSMGGVAVFLALILWYGLRIGRGAPLAAPSAGRLAGIAITPLSSAPSPLDQKLDHVLTEIRMVLPGAQVLLGLQLSVTLMQGFDALAASARGVYLASLGLMVLATILLMTPAAFHRIVERGEVTDRLRRLAAGMLIIAMAVLALALSGDVYVALSRVARLTDLAAAAAAVTALFFYVLWFAIPLLRRRSSGVREQRRGRG